MQDSSSTCISLRDALRVLFRHKWKAIGIFCLTAALALCAVFVLPEKYQSEARLFIRIGRASVSLDPTATVGKFVSMSESREREINSAVEILKSRELLEAVITEVGVDTIVRQFAVRSAAAQPERGLATAQPSSRSAQHDKALRCLKKSLACETAKSSNVITVSCQAGSPKLAQQILAVYLHAFKMHHLHLNRTSGSYEFFAEQSQRLKAQLDRAEQELRDAKNQVGVGSISGQKRMIESQVTSLERDLQSTRTALASAEVNVQVVRETYPDLQLDQDPRTGTGSSSAAIDGMQAELYKLQIRERELLARYSPKHPRVVAIQEQFRQAKRLLGIQKVMAERARVKVLNAQIGDLEEQCTQAKRHLLRLNEDEIRVNALAQEVLQLTTNYRKYRDHLEQARIDGALENDRISNVNIAQAPTLNPKPVSPQRMLIMVLGVIVGSFAGLAVTFVSEYFDDCFQTPDELERTLGLPVVLCVPQSYSEASLAS